MPLPAGILLGVEYNILEYIHHGYTRTRTSLYIYLPFSLTLSFLLLSRAHSHPPCHSHHLSTLHLAPSQHMRSTSTLPSLLYSPSLGPSLSLPFASLSSLTRPCALCAGSLGSAPIVTAVFWRFDPLEVEPAGNEDDIVCVYVCVFVCVCLCLEGAFGRTLENESRDEGV
jgi:hypothetical protein